MSLLCYLIGHNRVIEDVDIASGQAQYICVRCTPLSDDMEVWCE